ncbi:MAG: anthranilate synthase component I family protein [Actinomycetota bacterium]|nr:anthranilate synthase component I family protein [Actinomycetota bacterium]
MPLVFSIPRPLPIRPGKDEFLKMVSSGTAGAAGPVYAEIPFISPHLLYPLFSGTGSILLESAGGGIPRTASSRTKPRNQINRYSFLCFEPYASFKLQSGLVEVASHGRKSVATKKDPLSRLKEFLDAYPQKPSPELPPFQGGAAGLLSYGFVNYLEKLSAARPPEPPEIPDAIFYLYDQLIAFDHELQKAWIICCPAARETRLGYNPLNGNFQWEKSYHEACGAINSIADKLCAANPGNSAKTGVRAPAGELKMEHATSRKDYVAMVTRAKQYIAAGDIFQANLSLRLQAGMGGAGAWEIYSVLRAVNPAPFACFMDFGGFQIASSSPERLVLLRDGFVCTRPIAGTRPRGTDMPQDDLMKSELLLSEKERAEHIMLIDLERNDIGRVSIYGSVEVDELMTVEYYSHVMHIVSNIVGKLAPGKTAFDCIKAAFPGGTITGVPKVRCMEIINELEPVARGVYTGSAGYIGFNGRMDLNILIRTFLLKDGIAYVQAGAGIVADSAPEKEYEESLKKAEALLVTLDMVWNKPDFI